MNLEELLKSRMEYTEQPAPRCDKCKYVAEKTDQAGGWYDECHLNPAAAFTVNEAGRCKHYQPKTLTP